MLAHLDACLARMTYFGRAESITEIRRARDRELMPHHSLACCRAVQEALSRCSPFDLTPAYINSKPPPTRPK